MSGPKPIKQDIIFIYKLCIDYYIKLFTARFMGRNAENRQKAYSDGFNFIKKKFKKLIYF